MFSPGTTLQTVDVTLVRGTCTQTDKHLFGTIASPVNAVIVDDRGIAVIPGSPSCNR